MRIGIAGAGVMGSEHGAAWLNTDAEVTGLLVRDPGEAGPLAASLGAAVFTDLKEMIPHIDVIDICVPTHLHHAMVLECARLGVDIICEKPLARTLEQGREMVRECRRLGVKLIPAHVLRFFPEYRMAKEAVDRGDIGTTGMIRLSRESFAPRKAGDNWFLDYDKSGGLLLDLSLHDFDYARWVAGDVVSVYARTIKTDHPELPRDHALTILEHRSGVLTHVQGSWAYPPPEFHTRFEIAGSEGLLTFDSDESAPISLHSHGAAGEEGGEVGLPASPLEENPYDTEIRAFYDHLKEGTPLPLDDSDALAALQIALAAIESARTGRPVSLNPLPEVQS